MHRRINCVLNAPRLQTQLALGAQLRAVVRWLWHNLCRTTAPPLMAAATGTEPSWMTGALCVCLCGLRERHRAIKVGRPATRLAAPHVPAGLLWFAPIEQTSTNTRISQLLMF